MYVESMGRTLLNLFKSYYSQLAKQDSIVVSKNDLIAVEEATLKSLFTQKVHFCLGFLFRVRLIVKLSSFLHTVQVDTTKRNDTFALGDRDKILEQVRTYLTVYPLILFSTFTVACAANYNARGVHWCSLTLILLYMQLRLSGSPFWCTWPRPKTSAFRSKCCSAPC